MSFTSYEFIFCFLPLTVLGTALLSRLKNGVYKKLLLIALSLVFYAWASPAATLWLLASAAVTHLFARLIFKTAREHALARKALLGAGALFHVLFLCFFKYIDLSALRASLGDTLFLFVPMGVSFFTFQFIVHLVEVYRGKDAPSSPLDFLLFATFFPYRTMGPIMSHSAFAAELARVDALKPNANELGRGIYQFVLGMTKKLVLADTVATLATNGFALTGNASFAAAWGTALAYTFQLYFDFSGYSDMACGIGRMLNLPLPQNFDSPYKSESVSVFWRRWHMTLGRALTTSVYISLGGNRRGILRTCLNLFAVMAVSGIWHGDTVNFLIWGCAYGLILVFERLCEKPLSRIPAPLRKGLTFLTVLTLWVPFRAPTFAGALRIWRGMLNVTNLGLGQFAAICQDNIISLPSAVAILYGAALLVLCTVLVFCFKNTHEKTDSMRFDTKTALLLALLFFLCLIHMSRASVFLYENF
ncbi:MAG: MBOAT family protein [Clostridia bacterium]|nr:MBOAT family protein [Clostridia bacterium]